ncbi:methyltransferase domain-containing protein [Leucobacter sp. HY1910]
MRKPLLTQANTPHCDYFERGVCRSCVLIETPYERQLAEKEARCKSLLASVPEAAWLEPVEGGVTGFRNKAKLVVGGVPGDITLGILGPDQRGVDLRECLIQSPEIHAVIPAIARLLEESNLAPYDVPARRGELKFVHVTSSPAGRLMLRFVVRSAHAADRLTQLKPRLTQLVPGIEAASINLLPEHKAVLEGDEERPLIGSSLTMQLGPIALHLLPRSFFQTNTAVARALYAQAAEWVAAAGPASLWDLYCGVGGFALHCAPSVGSGSGSNGEALAPGPQVTGVEISEAAIDSAVRSAREAGLAAHFIAADATAFALGAREVPEMVIVNPPRRGIGAELAGWLEASGIERVIYSSCNPESLARDLAAMPGFRVQSARVFDMFPHTKHLEVMVLLERR